MLRTIASTLAGLAVVSGSAVATTPAVSAGDPAGDWEAITVSGETVDPSLLPSVDMKHLTVTRTSSGAAFGLKLHKVLPPGRVFQQFDVIVSADASAGKKRWRFEFNVTLQHPGGTLAGFQKDYRKLGSVDCEIGFSSTTRSVRVFVPQKCLPPGPGLLDSSVLLVTTRKLNPVAQDLIQIRGADVS